MAESEVNDLRSLKSGRIKFTAGRDQSSELLARAELRRAEFARLRHELSLIRFSLALSARKR